MRPHTFHVSTSSSTERVVQVLREGPLRFGDVVAKSGLSRRAAHIAVHRLIEGGIVMQAKNRGPYELRTDLLTSADLNGLTMGKEIVRVISGLEAEGKRISQIRGRRIRQSALASFLMTNLSLMAGYLTWIFLDASRREDVSASDKFQEKAMRTHIESWAGILNCLCFENQDVLPQSVATVWKPFADLTKRNFRQYQGLLFEHGA